MEVTIPRLCVSLPAEVVSDDIIGAFQQFSYSNPTASQKEVTLEFVKGRNVFVSYSTGKDKSLCYTTLPLVFDGLRQYLYSHLKQEFSGRCIASPFGSHDKPYRWLL